MIAAFAAAAGCALPAGCVGVRFYTDPLPVEDGVVPARFQQPPAATRPLHPPTPVDDGAARLSLDQLIQAVLVRDPKLRSGFEAINQAQGNALTAALPPNPTVFTDIQLLPLTRPFTVTDQGGPPQFDFQVTQPIDWFVFGKRAANMAREALGVKVSEADYADLVRQRVVEAANTYFDVAEAVALRDLARQDVENLRRVEAVTQKAVEAGGRPQVELNRVRLDLLAAERANRDTETALVTARAKLNALVGVTAPGAGIDVAGGLETLPAAAPLPDDEAFAVAARQRPDVESRRRKVAQARADIMAQTKAAYPALAPQLGYTRQFQTKAIGFPDANSWMAAVTVGLPLFDRNQGNRAKAVSVTAQAEYDLHAALAALQAEVVTAGQELRVARANVEAVAGDQLRLAREVLEAITQAYEVGGRPLLDVLDAQKNFRETYRLYISSRATYGREVYQYGAALGQQVTR